MNPYFGHNTDIKHIKRAFECLKNNGRLVAIVSGSSMNRNSTRKIIIKFHELLDNYPSKKIKLDSKTDSLKLCIYRFSTKSRYDGRKENNTLIEVFP
jgi:dynactin complex subunit